MAGRRKYDKLRASAAADDITPEMFYSSALHEYLPFEKMKPVAEGKLSAGAGISFKPAQRAVRPDHPLLGAIARPQSFPIQV